MSSPFESLLFGELRAADAGGDYRKVGLVLNLGLDILELDQIRDLAMAIPSEAQDKIIDAFPSFANEDEDHLDIFFKFLWKTPIVKWGISIPQERRDQELHSFFESFNWLYTYLVGENSRRSYNDFRAKPALLVVWSMAQWEIVPTDASLKDLFDFFSGQGRPRPEGMEGPYGQVGWARAEDTLKKEIRNATKYFGFY